MVPEAQWGETEHELQRRVIVDQARLTADQALLLSKAVRVLIDDRVIEVVPRGFYGLSGPAE